MRPLVSDVGEIDSGKGGPRIAVVQTCRPPLYSFCC